MFDRTFYGVTLAQWAYALGLAIGGWLLLVGIRHVAIGRLQKVAARTASAVDDLILGALRRTSVVFLLALAMSGAEHATHVLPPAVDAPFDVLVKLVALLQGASWGLGAIAFWVTHVTRRHADDKSSVTTINVLAILLRVVLWTVLLLLALQAFGVEVTALLTTLGIAGIAVALAVQNVLGDLFASLSIALDKPFVIGDTINVDNYTGTVEDIGLKTTRLRALSGELLIFSNADLLKSRLRNFRGQSERRVVLALTLAPDTPPDALARVPELLRTIVSAESQVRFDRSHVSAITDTGVAVETVWMVTTGEYAVHMDIQQRILLALLRRFADEKIALVRPTPAVVVAGAEARAEGKGQTAEISIESSSRPRTQ